MLCKTCGQLTDESKSGLCQSCGQPLAIGEYAPPDSYAYHEESNLYYQESSGYDPQTGAYMRQVMWFDPNSGEYHPVNYPQSAIIPEPMEALPYDGGGEEDDWLRPDINEEEGGETIAAHVIGSQEERQPPQGFVLDPATQRYYSTKLENGKWVVTWWNKNDSECETMEDYAILEPPSPSADVIQKQTAVDAAAQVQKSKKRGKLVPVALSLLLVLGSGFAVWYFRLYEYLPALSIPSSSQAEQSSSQTEPSSSQTEPSSSQAEPSSTAAPATSSVPEPSKPESNRVSDIPESSSIPEPPVSSSSSDTSKPASTDPNEIPTDKTGFVLNQDWFGRSLCIDRILPNGKWENYDGTKAAYINHHTNALDFTLWLVIYKDGKTVDYQCEMIQDESDSKRYIFQNSDTEIIVNNFEERSIAIHATIHGVFYGVENFSVVWDKDAIDDAEFGTENWSGGTQFRIGSYVCRNVNGLHMDLEYSPRITLRADNSFSFLINAGEGMDERYGTYSVSGQVLTLHFDGISGGYTGAEKTTTTLTIDDNLLILDEDRFGLSDAGAVFVYLP